MVKKRELGTKINVENLYKHVYKLEGYRHPLRSIKRLEETADYILDEFTRYGLDTREQYFSIEGFSHSFRNIEADLCLHTSNNTPPIVVTAHYDTAYRTPGADDNASAVAVMLETARVLQENECQYPVKFIGLCLEEASPVFIGDLLEFGKQAQLVDDDLRPLTERSATLIKQFLNLLMKTNLSENDFHQFETDHFSQLSPEEQRFFKKRIEYGKKDLALDSLGEKFLIGSHAWVTNMLENNLAIKGVINLEMVGFSSPKPQSQTWLPGMDQLILEEHKVNRETNQGNFLAIVSNKESAAFAQSITHAWFETPIDLPFIHVHAPFDIETIFQSMKDLLLSDHTSFWKYGIPAVMLTDTAYLRNPYYHTEGDSLTTLDFQFMKKVCEAVVLAVNNL
ncbi:MAG: M28 family peptidase [Candidatus Hodarchaeales archaeon]|jgi:hypothetical protein